MILENFNNFNSNTNYCSNNNPYPDVTRADWSFQYVCKGTQDQTITGYLSGDDRGYFRPARTVNMAEFSALLLRNLKNVIQPSSSSWSYEDVNVNSWYSGYAKYFQDNNIVTGNFFNPDQGLTRRQAAEIIYKLHQLGKL